MKDVYEEIGRINKIPIGDFPAVEYYEKACPQLDFTKFPTRNERLSAMMDEILMRDLPNFMSMISPELPLGLQPETELNPFFEEEIDEDWDIPLDFQTETRQLWNTLSPTGEPLGGGQLKNTLAETKAPKIHLKKIWTLANIGKKGKLDEDEFLIAMWLAKRAAEGTPPPEVLPEHLIPPSKREKDQ